MIKMIKMVSKSVTIVGVGLIGYFAGAIATKRKTKYAGILRIDNSEEDIQDRLFLELHTDLNKIEKSKAITLKVIRKNWI